MVSAAIASNCCVLKHTLKEVNNNNNNTFVGGYSLKSLSVVSHLLKPSKKTSRYGPCRLVVASSSGNTTTTQLTQASGRFYFNITGFPFPLGPFLNRRTFRTEVTFSIFTFVALLFTLFILHYIYTFRDGEIHTSFNALRF